MNNQIFTPNPFYFRGMNRYYWRNGTIYKTKNKQELEELAIKIYRTLMFPSGKYKEKTTAKIFCRSVKDILNDRG